MKDKEVLLPLVGKLDERVKEAFSALDNICHPWLELKSQGLVIRESANQILAAEQHSLLNIVAVCGPLRTGKSFLMNCLMESEVFGVSSQAESYTQGIHLSSLLLPCSRFGTGGQEPRIGFVDMEGQADKGMKYDVKLATPLLQLHLGHYRQGTRSVDKVEAVQDTAQRPVHLFVLLVGGGREPHRLAAVQQSGHAVWATPWRADGSQMHPGRGNDLSRRATVLHVAHVAVCERQKALRGDLAGPAL
jgi:hypothetical protein